MGGYSALNRVVVPRYKETVTMTVDESRNSITLESSIEFGEEEVPCNPILNFFGLLRFDKNRAKFNPTTEWEFSSEEAKRLWNEAWKKT